MCCFPRHLILPNPTQKHNIKFESSGAESSFARWAVSCLGISLFLAYQWYVALSNIMQILEKALNQAMLRLKITSGRKENVTHNIDFFFVTESGFV